MALFYIGRFLAVQSGQLTLISPAGFGDIPLQISLFDGEKPRALPDDYWRNHISATFVETVRWWIENGMKETPEELNRLIVENINNFIIGAKAIDTL